MKGANKDNIPGQFNRETKNKSNCMDRRYLNE